MQLFVPSYHTWSITSSSSPHVASLSSHIRPLFTKDYNYASTFNMALISRHGLPSPCSKNFKIFQKQPSRAHSPSGFKTCLAQAISTTVSNSEFTHYEFTDTDDDLLEMDNFLIHEHESLEACPALLLNSDFSPVSFIPLSVLSWKDVIKAIVLDRVQVLATYEGRTVRSPSVTFELPAVVVLKKYRKTQSKSKVPCNRFNVCLRDKFRCQYCLYQFSYSQLTVDHVIPKSRGGDFSWGNVVAACTKCNNIKANSMLSEAKHRLGDGAKKLSQKPPVEPSVALLQANAKASSNFHFRHHSWQNYLKLDSFV